MADPELAISPEIDWANATEVSRTDVETFFNDFPLIFSPEARIAETPHLPVRARSKRNSDDILVIEMRAEEAGMKIASGVFIVVKVDEDRFTRVFAYDPSSDSYHVSYQNFGSSSECEHC